MGDLREEFLPHCEARNISRRTLDWYADRTRRFTDWCVDRGITEPSDLRWSDLQAFVLDRRRRGFADNTVHGYAQVVKTLCRVGHRLGYIPEDITDGFEMPRVPKTIIPTFNDEQLETLLATPDKRTWVGIRDRAILVVLLDTLIRVSELVGLDAEDSSRRRSDPGDGQGSEGTGSPVRESCIPGPSPVPQRGPGPSSRRPVLHHPLRTADEPVGSPPDDRPALQGDGRRGCSVLAAHAPAHGREAVHPGGRRRVHA